MLKIRIHGLPAYRYHFCRLVRKERCSSFQRLAPIFSHIASELANLHGLRASGAFCTSYRLGLNVVCMSQPHRFVKQSAACAQLSVDHPVKSSFTDNLNIPSPAYRQLETRFYSFFAMCLEQTDGVTSTSSFQNRLRGVFKLVF